MRNMTRSLLFVFASAVAVDGAYAQSEPYLFVFASGNNSDDTFWNVVNNTSLDVVQIMLDLPPGGQGRRFDSGAGSSINLDSVKNFHVDDVVISFPGNNNDNLGLDFTPGSFRGGAGFSFFADIDEFASIGDQVTGIGVSVTLADGTLLSDRFRLVDPDPFFEFGPQQSGAVFVPGPGSGLMLAAFGAFAARRRRW